MGYAFFALAVFIGILYKNNVNHPLFFASNHSPVVYGHGIKFNENGAYHYRKIHTIEHDLFGLHRMKTTIKFRDDEETLKKAYNVFFWDQDTFSIILTSKDKHYTAKDEPDPSEAHTLEYRPEQFFQIVYQDKELFCYASLPTNSVKCVKLIA